MSHSAEVPIEISVSQLADLRQANEDFILLDVRELDEYETAKIKGSRLLPMGELQSRMSELASHRDDHIVVHCHHGGRSMHVVQALRQAGFSRVQNLAGGIDQWSVQVDQAVPRY